MNLEASIKRKNNYVDKPSNELKKVREKFKETKDLIKGQKAHAKKQLAIKDDELREAKARK